MSPVAMRRWFGIDWLCQGCHRQGSYRWLKSHDCPKRDEFEAEAAAWFKKHPYPGYYSWMAR
jgi:hypothetical protein